jgi:hypothetical protein
LPGLRDLAENEEGSVRDYLDGHVRLADEAVAQPRGNAMGEFFVVAPRASTCR